MVYGHLFVFLSASEAPIVIMNLQFVKTKLGKLRLEHGAR